MPEYESSVIKQASYDASKRELEVEFRSGAVYKYADVPPEEAEAFAASSSKGGFFTAYIRNSYQASRVEVEDVESFPFETEKVAAAVCPACGRTL